MAKRIENERLVCVYNMLVLQKKVKNKSDFARQIGLNSHNIYDLFYNRYRIQAKILDKMAENFGISKKYILLGEGEMFVGQKPIKNPINHRINKIAVDFFDNNSSKFADFLEMSAETVRNYRKNTSPRIDILDKICEKLEISYEWIISGNGEMFRKNSEIVRNTSKFPVNAYESPTNNRRMIPLYNDVSSIGGVNSLSANMDGVQNQDEYIDAGDWFVDATAAIRHFGDSMLEYPSGCILAIREIFDRKLIIFGQDYVIETREYRLTKRIQKGQKEKYITAYSTNSDTYADGRLIHEPVDIRWNSISRIFIVLGYVVKKNDGFNNHKE